MLYFTFTLLLKFRWVLDLERTIPVEHLSSKTSILNHPSYLFIHSASTWYDLEKVGWKYSIKSVLKSITLHTGGNGALLYVCKTFLWFFSSYMRRRPKIGRRDAAFRKCSLDKSVGRFRLTGWQVLSGRRGYRHDRGPSRAWPGPFYNGIPNANYFIAKYYCTLMIFQSGF